jgi:hypothetical protein
MPTHSLFFAEVSSRLPECRSYFHHYLKQTITCIIDTGFSLPGACQLPTKMHSVCDGGGLVSCVCLSVPGRLYNRWLRTTMSIWRRPVPIEIEWLDGRVRSSHSISIHTPTVQYQSTLQNNIAILYRLHAARFDTKYIILNFQSYTLFASSSIAALCGIIILATVLHRRE